MSDSISGSSNDSINDSISGHFADDLPIAADDFTRRACDPRASVVVEACAGSGKTWLLVSRIVRLLLAGAEPGQLLAITFTRRGAQEMRARLQQQLQALARDSDADVLLDLQRRGLSPADARAALPGARQLYERVLTARVPITIDTFHGWYWQLLACAPLAAGVPFAPVLLEQTDRVQRDAWLHFTAQLIEPRHAPHRAAWELLIDELGDYSARVLLLRFLHKRAEWWSFAAGDEDNAVARALAPLQAACNEDAGAVLHADDFMAAVQVLLDTWLAVASPAKYLTDAIEAARQWLAGSPAKVRDGDGGGDGDDGDRNRASDFSRAAQIVLTKANTPRDMLLPERISKKFFSLNAAYSTAHALVVERLLQAMADQESLRVLRINQAAFACGRLLIAAYQQLKAQQQALDFTDLEWQAHRLLADADHAAYLQSRLDARYRHILLDEFQDTNPLQWQALQSWLAAYGPTEDSGAEQGAGAGGDGRPTVFVVGDPKQSIYRFRRAEPRVFDAALELLRRDYQAIHLRTNVTRRNAQAVLDVLNDVLPAANPLYQPQSTLAGAHGAFVLLPLARASAAGATLLRDANDADPPATSAAEVALSGNGSTPSHDRAAALVFAPLGGALLGGSRVGAAPSDAARSNAAVSDLALRDVLITPRSEPESETRYREGSALANEIAHWVRTLAAADGAQPRPARWADVMLLVRARTHLDDYERALRDAGVPFVSDRRGGLLATLEADDLTSLLQVLTAPFSDLKLAHALRSPVFGCSDQELVVLAAARGATWWQRLMTLAMAADSGSAPLARARRLLARWRELAGVLPVHDLLDRIYCEGDLRERYAAAVPAAMHAQVQANLDAFIELALAIDAGRYPSLPRFIDELAHLKQGADDEAPDEGNTDAGDAVRVLTIHGAKGLEAEIVAIADAHSLPRPEGGRVLLAWPPQAAAPEHISFATAAAGDAARAPWFADEEAQRVQEERNLLYVAATRARQVLIVSGAEPANSKAEDTTWYAQLQRARSRSSLPAAMQSRSDPLPGRKVLDFRPVPVKIGQRQGDAPDSEALRLGRAWHSVLESDPDGVPGADELARAHALTPMQVEVVQAAAARVRAALPQFFGPGSDAELELMSAEGELLRVDRLIEQDDALWIIDFKWRIGDNERAQYEAQVRRYGEVLRAIRSDKPVRLGLVTSDGALLTVSR